MPNICKIAAAAAIAFALGTSSTTQALPITGSISFYNGTNNGGLTLPPVPSTQITSYMESITQGAPVVDCSGGSTGALACDLPGPVTAGNFNTNGPFPVTIYTYGGFTFELLRITGREDYSLSHFYYYGDNFVDSLVLTMEGMVSGNGYDPTPFSARWIADGWCTGQGGPPPTCTANVTASWSVHIETPFIAMPELSVVMTPDNGTFQQGAQVAFTIVVRNSAAAGAASATNVTLTDQLPGNGGLVWSNVVTSQGSCTIVSNLLSCALGTIAPQSSVTVQVSSAASTPAAACQFQTNPVARATADGGLSAQDGGWLNCTPIITPTTAQLSVVKTPDSGIFQPGAQVAFTIVVGNPAATGAESATGVWLTDQLPGNGGLVWSNVSTSQGSCLTPIVGNLLDCDLGTIAPQSAVTVIVSSASTTPANACQFQPNPVARATADRGLSAQDSGSLDCTLLVTEFYNSILDHYFLTADPIEAMSIGAGGSGPGWARTDHTFKSGGPNTVCRFRGVPAAGGPNGHFYTADPAECEQVKRDPGWLFESLDFSITPPNPGGVCPAGLAKVYRAYNNRFAQHDSNHRITADFAAYQAQVALGWVGEGVVMCAP